jgi:hypothetical protein
VKTHILWDVRLYGPGKVNRRFGVTPPLNAGSEREPRKQQSANRFIVLPARLVYFYTPKMDVIFSSKKPIGFWQTTRSYLPEDTAPLLTMIFLVHESIF